ncbi:beta-ketoacyl-ACP reductase [Ferviditalea candida]|uniref:Beta-ketoacyl-ACP reductase n=1 Tax=Ferviditalea candida TaxID=3108399 RepID=A0ABU5ZJ65_9BACL|nr:beta-ketoacyl-ACP reductase [Paenibacillaceae bacterium T2]
MRLAGKVAVVTGGLGGIGKATVQRFLEEGARVVIGDFKLEGAEAALSEWDAADRVKIVQVDVASPEQARSMAEAAIAAFGRIDILINNAGITIDGLLMKMEEQAWQKVIDVNLTGVFNCTKAVVPHMIEQGSGVVLNASSVVALYGNIGQTNYAATKAGVIGLTKSWAKEFGPKGIRVNAVAPGFIMTDMTAKVPHKILDTMVSKTPLRKLGQPEDIAAAYLFLASDEAGYINGTVLSVDGGLVI